MSRYALSPSDLPVLAFDTSGPYVAVGLWGQPNLDPLFEEMPRGQAESLPQMCEELLAQGSLGWGDIKAIGVGIGPGNFTGARISVSFARGLALSLGIPAVGVTGFEWLHQGNGYSGRVAVTLPAPREQVYAQVFSNMKPITEAVLVTVGERHPTLEHPNLIVAGYRASEIAAPHDAESDESLWERRIERMIGPCLGLIAWNKLRDNKGKWTERPAPLYIRPADAAPSSDPPPKILP